MAVSVEFDGRYQATFRDVSPRSIVLRGKSLFVQGQEIPVREDRLIEVFKLLARETNYKHGKVVLVLLVNGDIKYASTTSNDTVDYFAGRILGWGSNSPSYHMLPHSSYYDVPSDDEYMTGEDVINYY